MKHLTYRWKSRFVIILVVSMIISTLLIFLDLTEWATQINQQGFTHEGEEGKNIPSVLMYILPFIKEIILICVPMFLSLLVIKAFSILKKKKKG